jgi:hypothetical protein
VKVAIRPHFIGREPYWEEHGIFYSHCVGAGWQDHLHQLTLKLEALGWDGYLEQVKEKFGTLRFYWCNNIEGIKGEIAEDVVAYAEGQTAYICESCGEHGELRNEGWVKCRCDECWEKENAPKPPRGELSDFFDDLVKCTCKGDFTCEAHRA